jgi:L-histidine N-alpha-methyltransferase
MGLADHQRCSEDPIRRFRLDVHADEATGVARLAEDVRRGLGARPRSLPPKYFYDRAGCRLFERITALPEYYLTRIEEAILGDVAAAVARHVRPRDIVELGPGSCRKVRRVLDAVDGRSGVRYVPVDVDRDGLAGASRALIRAYPALDVHAVVGDFERHLGRVPPAAGRRLVLFLGSTIGNFDPPDRRRLLSGIRRLLAGHGRLLLGVDLVKDRRALESAYNDAAGVTRAFNRNILRVVNRALDGDFQPAAYRHHAFYRAEASRIEMHLVATAPQRVRLRRLDLAIELAEGEGIWTESSYKFTRASVAGMLAEAGMAMEAWYTDARVNL